MKLMRVMADDYEELEALSAGDIAAVTGPASPLPS